MSVGVFYFNFFLPQNLIRSDEPLLPIMPEAVNVVGRFGSAQREFEAFVIRSITFTVLLVADRWNRQQGYRKKTYYITPLSLGH